MKKTMMIIAAVLLAAVLLVGSGSAADKVVTGIDDLSGAVIGVQLGTTGDELVTAFEGDANGTKIERYNKGADAVQALKTGKIDCVVIDLLPAQSFVEKNSDLMILSEGFDQEEYALVVKKGNTELVDAINRALAELKADGTIDQINANFIPTSELKVTCPYVSPEGIERPNGKLVVATNAEFPPYEYWESGKITGIDMHIMQAICDKLGYAMKIEDMAFDSIIAAVSSGKADVGAAGMSVTEDRMKNVDFSDPYTTAQQVIIVKKPVTSTTEPGEATPTKAPAPVLGILAGLGAAVVLLRNS